MEVKCLFCSSSNAVNSPYENTFFNKKEFSYLKCGDCGLVYLDPLPDEQDYDVMYPTSYQGELASNPTGYYDWLFADIKNFKSQGQLLDYGCGNGRFVVEALSKGYEVTGVEYNPKMVSLLQDTLPKAQFLSINFFNTDNKLYDIIFLGNVLEHLSNPFETLRYLKSRLTNGGIIVLEGPIEDNFTLAGIARRYYFKYRKHRGHIVTHPPRHIFYANRDNQLSVFKEAGYLTLKYKINEVSWPFPESLKECTSTKEICLFIIAKISKNIGKLLPRNGNVFFYIGRATS